MVSTSGSERVERLNAVLETSLFRFHLNFLRYSLLLYKSCESAGKEDAKFSEKRVSRGETKYLFESKETFLAIKEIKK